MSEEINKIDVSEDEENEMLADAMDPENMLMHEVVNRVVINKMVQTLEKIERANYHLKKQGSNERMTVEDLLEKLPNPAPPGVQAFKAAWKIDSLVNKATMIFLERKNSRKK